MLQKKQERLFPLPSARNPFFVVPIRFNRVGPEGFKGDRKTLWSPPAEAKSSEKQNKKVRLHPLLPQEIYFFVVPIRFNRVGPKVSKGDRALWSPPQRRNPEKQKKKVKALPLAFARKSIFYGPHPFQQVGTEGPKGDRKALWSPPWEKLRETEKKKKALLAFHKKSISCERFRPPGWTITFPRESTQSAGGGKSACGMAAPVPVAKKQCTASLAEARSAGFTSVP